METERGREGERPTFGVLGKRFSKSIHRGAGAVLTRWRSSMQRRGILETAKRANVCSNPEHPDRPACKNIISTEASI